MRYLVISIIVVILLVIYLYIEDNILKVKKIKINNKKIPKDFNNYKIALISDLHSTNKKVTIKCIIKNVIKEKADILVISGDLIDERRLNQRSIIYLIDRLVKKTKVYYVSGNHESYSFYYYDFLDKLISKGVNVIDNKCEILSKNKSKINIVGFKDIAFLGEDESKDFVQGELNKLIFNKENYTILVSHRPEFIDLYSNIKADLTLSGHAHGGQVRIPFIGGMFAPGQGLFPRLTSGLHKSGNMDMVITRGIGNSGFPFRINNRPELVIITLRNEVSK